MTRLTRQTLRFLITVGVVATAFTGLFLWRSDARSAGMEMPIARRAPDEQRIIDVYRATNEAVVFITTTTLTVDPFDVLPGARPHEGTGSGVVVDAARGVVLTSLHVIQDAHKIEISLANGLNYRARLLGFDGEYDIAALQIIDPPEKLTSVVFGDSSKLEVGQRMLAIGNPFRLTRTLTTGIVSSVDRTVRNPGGTLMRGLIQTDAAINPGNSGGPLLDTEGRLVGINSAILSQSGDSAGIGFAVPINQIKRVLPELIATGKVLRPTFGWILADTTQGPMVRRVFPDGPASEAGIQPVERRVENIFLQGYVLDFTRGDLIVKVNGVQVRSKDEVEELISRSDPNEPVTVTLRLGGPSGRERTVTMKAVLK